jgi:uncharacterized membrane protein YraQ (UPF0718 family)
MLVPTIIMGLLAALLLIVAYRQGEGQHMTGLKAALNMTFDVLPLLIFAFIVAGMVQALLPPDQVSKWVGEESGLRGIFIGAAAGGFSPGGPFVSLPIAAGLLRTGASAGTVVAYLTGWSLWAVARLPMEVGILIFPPIAGVVAQLLFSGPR